MRLFGLVMVIFSLAVLPAGCVRSACSGACKIACGFIPTASPDAGAVGGAMSLGRSVCEAICDSDIVKNQCNAWVSGKIDSLGILSWIERNVAGHLSGGVKRAKANFPTRQ